jgi:hypothetical protein
MPIRDVSTRSSVPVSSSSSSDGEEKEHHADAGGVVRDDRV